MLVAHFHVPGDDPLADAFGVALVAVDLAFAGEAA